MGLLSRTLRGNIQSAYSLADFEKDFFSHFYGGKPAMAGVRVNEETAMRFSAVSGCVKIISEDIGMLPCEVRKWRDPRNQSKGSDLAFELPLYDMMKNNPHPDMDSMSFDETIQSHVLLSGNGYAYKDISMRGEVTKLTLLNWYCVTPQRNKQTKALEYIYDDGNGKPQTLSRDEIFHLHGIGFDGISGYSPVRMTMEAIGLGLAAEEFAARFYSNGANVGGFIEMPNKVKDKEALKKEFSEKFAGLGKAHKVVFLEEGSKFQKLVMPLNEAQFIETRKFQIEEIARWYRMPMHMLQELSKATFCLPGDAEVYTVEGPRQIKDIKPGDNVWSLNADGLWVQSRVARSAQTGYDEILTIKTTNRTIRLNGKHRVLARVKVPAPVGGAGGYQCIDWENQWIPAGQLTVGDTIVNLSALPDGGNNIAPNSRPLTIGFMEFCGLLLGGGNISRHQGEPTGVQIARAEGAPYMDHYRSVMSQEFTSGKWQKGPVKVREGIRQTRFSSVSAGRELRLLGFSGTARTKRVPGWVFGLSAELRAAFLRGFLDADGSVDKQGRMSFSSCNRLMLSQIRHLCVGLGVPVTNLRCQVGETTLPNGKRISFSQWNFTCSDPGANRLIGSHTPTYNKRLGEGRPFGRKERNYPRHGGRDFGLVGCELARICDIKRQALIEPVYDLEVEGTHSFVADGVVVHNSNIEHQDLAYVKRTLLPWIRRREIAIDTQLLTKRQRDMGYFAHYNLNEWLRGDSKTQAEVNHLKRQDGIITANEIRVADNMNPREEPEADMLIINGNMREISVVKSQDKTAVSDPTKARR